MSPLYGMCVGIALVVSWQVFRWLADRLTFKTTYGAISGRVISSALVGALLSFLLAGLFMEFVIFRREISGGLNIPVAKGLSSFAAGVFGGMFGLVWGLIWGLVRGLRDADAMRNAGEQNK